MMEALFTTILMLCVAIVIPGVINRTRAVLSGRKGIRMFQHLYDVEVMLRKNVVLGDVTTLLFRIAPSIYLGAIFTAMLFMPLGGFEPLLHFRGDIVMFAYLLGFSRAILILGALDTGSSFEGMGASRDALYGAMVEPAIFIVGGTLALASGMTGFSDIFEALTATSLSAEITIVLILLLLVVAFITVVECGRIPVDDPRTHLELTMIHEVMVLDYCGVDLAMITVGGWIKMTIMAVLAGNIIASIVGGGWIMVVVIALLLGGTIGLVESFMGRNKLSRNPTFILTIVAMAFLLFMVVFMLSLDISIG